MQTKGETPILQHMHGTDEKDISRQLHVSCVFTRMAGSLIMVRKRISSACIICGKEYNARGLCAYHYQKMNGWGNYDGRQWIKARTKREISKLLFRIECLQTQIRGTLAYYNYETRRIRLKKIHNEIRGIKNRIEIARQFA